MPSSYTLKISAKSAVQRHSNFFYLEPNILYITIKFEACFSAKISLQLTTLTILILNKMKFDQIRFLIIKLEFIHLKIHAQAS